MIADAYHGVWWRRMQSGNFTGFWVRLAMMPDNLRAAPTACATGPDSFALVALSQSNKLYWMAHDATSGWGSLWQLMLDAAVEAPPQQLVYRPGLWCNFNMSSTDE